MLLSIISGTHQRLPYLRRMVESARQSIPAGISYEFCIVDGNSKDGTIEWMKKQPDIRWIQHGKLLGAIKAFNDAAELATGRYVLPANDDIAFMGKTIGIGLSYMLDHPETGAGCFFQNRAGREPHVETMEVIHKSQKLYMPYVQVGLIPKWLWDYENKSFQKGWGNYGARTYGGDNYVSAKILSLGYEIREIKGTMIDDATPIDGLRQTNNEHNKGGADGEKYYAQFPNGVPYHDSPQVKNPLPKTTKILYAPIIEPGHDQAKLQKRGLRDALAKVGAVYEVDYCYMQESIAAAAKLWKPDIVITQIHNADEKMVKEIKEVRKHCKGVMINWNGDVYGEQQREDNYKEMLSYFDLHTNVNYSTKEFYENNGINYKYIQNSFEPGITGLFKDIIYDVAFLANGYGQSRHVLAAQIKALPCKTLLVGNQFDEFKTDGNFRKLDSTLYDFKKTGNLIRNCKIVIGDNQYPNDLGFFSDRVWNSLAAGGAVLFHQFVPMMEELNGLKDGVHLVIWRTYKELVEKIKYYLEHEDERKKIAYEGTKYVRENHSFDNRVQELMSLIPDLQKDKHSISVCMICKNEMDHIDRLMEEVKIFDEVVVLDTGSTDGSHEKLLEYQSDKVKIYHSDWVDDFSEARNAALRLCTKEWILHLDFDEHLDEKAVKSIKDFPNWDFTKHGIARPLAYRVNVVDEATGMSATITRLFKKLPGIYWENRVHETIDDAIDRAKIKVLYLLNHDFQITHIGRKDRNRHIRNENRNLQLLAKEPKTLRRIYYEGASLMALGSWSVACKIYEDALETMDFSGELEIYKGYFKFCVAYSQYVMKLCPKKTVELLEESDFIDSRYLLGLMKNSTDEMIKYIKSNPPMDLPSFYKLWKPDAVEKVRKVLEGFLKTAKSSS